VTAPFVYIDTNVFIAGFESPIENARPVQDFLRALRERPGIGISSELTLAEILAPVSRPHALPAVKRRRLYFDLLLWSGLIDLRPVTREILIETADLRSVARHKLPDAIHVVTAVHAHCSFFLSHDDGMKRLPQGMRRVRADESGVDEILRALSQ